MRAATDKGAVDPGELGSARTESSPFRSARAESRAARSLSDAGLEAKQSPIPASCLALGILLLSVGCRTVDEPRRVVTAYADALGDGRLDDAYQLTSAEFRAREPVESYRARYADAAARRERAGAILAGVPALRARSADVEAAVEGGVWRVAEVAAAAGPREALARFLDAADSGDFQAAYAQLSSAWRARYTPDRFARDFAAEPEARARLARARAALAAEAVSTREGADFPLGEGRAVRLVREAGAYRVAALE